MCANVFVCALAQDPEHGPANIRVEVRLQAGLTSRTNNPVDKLHLFISTRIHIKDPLNLVPNQSFNITLNISDYISNNQSLSFGGKKPSLGIIEWFYSIFKYSICFVRTV